MSPAEPVGNIEKEVSGVETSDQKVETVYAVAQFENLPFHSVTVG